MRKLATFTAVIAVLAAGMARASDQKAASKATEVRHADFEGTLVCLGCSLKKADGARAQCSDFGHTHAVKTADGKYVSLLPNKYSAALLKGESYSGKPIAIHGVYYAAANQLDVETIKVDGKLMSWCAGHGAMDGCAFAKTGSK